MSLVIGEPPRGECETMEQFLARGGEVLRYPAAAAAPTQAELAEQRESIRRYEDAQRARIDASASAKGRARAALRYHRSIGIRMNNRGR